MKIVSNKHTIPALNRKPDNNIKIIVSPQNKTVNTLSTYRQTAQINVPPPPPPPLATAKQIVVNKGILKQRTTKNKKPIIQYNYQEPPPDYKANIYGLVNCGVGRILIVLGNGPSLNEVPIEQLNNRPKIDILSINKPDPRVWPTKFWSFYDTSQFRRNEDTFNSYEGILLNSTSIKRHKPKSVIFRNIGGMKFSRDLIAGLCIGRTSCYAAIQLALWMKYDKIYFFGVDMDAEGIDGHLHFYGTNPDVDPNIRKTRFKIEADYFEYAAESMDYQERKRFYFCSSYLTWPFKARYNHLDHRTAVDEILNHEAQM
jgi:hypothetical protein